MRARSTSARAWSSVSTSPEDRVIRALPPPSVGAVYRPLGLLRLALAATVVVYHAPLDLLPLWASTSGPVAAFVFFALSGFVIAEAATRTYAGRPAAFLANRVLRLYPPYLIALALGVAVAGLGDLRAQLPAAAFDARNLALNLVAPFPVATPLQRALGLDLRHEFVPLMWAVRIEFAFYLAVAAVLALALPFGEVGRRRLIAAALVAALVGHVLSFYVSPFAGGAQAILSYAPCFVVGIAWFLLDRECPSHDRIALVAVLTLALGLAVARTLAYPLNHLRDGIDVLGAQNPAVAGGAVATFVGGLLLAAALSRRRAAPVARRIDRRAGDLAYPIFLVHIAVFAIAARLVRSAALATLVGIAASVALAAAIDAAMKRYVDPLRDRLRGRPAFEAGP